MPLPFHLLTKIMLIKNIQAYATDCQTDYQSHSGNLKQTRSYTCILEKVSL